MVQRGMASKKVRPVWKISILALLLILGVCFYFVNPFTTDAQRSLSLRDKMRTDDDDALLIWTENSDWSSLSDSQIQKRHFQAKKRNRLRGMRAADEADTLSNQQMYMVPQVACPTMVRLGTVDDGGKWTCNPWRAVIQPSSSSKPCVVYSFGVADDTTFERDLYEMTAHRCQIICVDPSDQSPDIFSKFNGVFIRASITPRTDSSRSEISIPDLMRRFNHTNVEFMKVDIEGGELETLKEYLLLNKEIDHDRSPVCQILVEMHWWGSYRRWLQLFEALEQKGFRMFAKEANSYCANCHEYSYIHSSCLEKYGLKKDSVYFTLFD